jgi:N-acetylglucosamine malate deacetylase 1
MPNSVLALFAHPDDVEFLCAGTLALLALRGWRVTIITATPGDCGSAEVPGDEISAIRRKEAAQAAALLGADYFCLEERDLAIDYNTSTRRKFTEAIRRTQPDLVLTHPLADYMADHEIVGRLVRDAAFAAPMPNFQAGSAASLPHIPHLYYADPLTIADADSPVPPTTCQVDITTVMDTKRQMLSRHQSQRDWLRRQHGVDEYLRLQEEIARRRGASAGCEFAEGFQQHRGHPYPTDDLIQAALG